MEPHDRRTFLRAAGGAALGLALGPIEGTRLADASPLPLAPPSIGWAAAAEEAFQSSWVVHEHWLHYLLEAGGADDPRDAGRFLPDGSEAFAAYVPPAPYELARVVERQKWYEAMRQDARWTSTPCTPAEVSELSSREIRSRLASLKIDASPRAFLALVGETTSPWSIARRWQKQVLLPGPEDDFVALAARELWRRTSPRPDDEQLDDWAHMVLPDCDRGDSAGACVSGLRAWEELRPRWSSAITTTKAADRCWAGSVPLANFVPALVLRLRQSGEPRFLLSAIAVVDEALGIFREEERSFREALARERALLARASS